LDELTVVLIISWAISNEAGKAFSLFFLRGIRNVSTPSFLRDNDQDK